MTYQKVMGTFKVRGDESVKNIPTLSEFAQENKIDSIIKVGSTTVYWISVVTYQDDSNNINQQMVKHGLYDFMSFTSEEDLKAYNNMSNQVRRALGAYSNKYGLH